MHAATYTKASLAFKHVVKTDLAKIARSLHVNVEGLDAIDLLMSVFLPCFSSLVSVIT